MIITPHFVFGAAVGSLVKNPFLAVILAFLGHYVLDFIPHIDYPIENIKKKQWQNIFPELIMVAVDFFVGIFLISIFSNNQPIIYICAFFAILSDGLDLLNLFFSNRFLKAHKDFHHEKIHFLNNVEFVKIKTKYGTIVSFLGRVLTQIAVVVISIFLMT